MLPIPKWRIGASITLANPFLFFFIELPFRGDSSFFDLKYEKSVVIIF